MLNGSLCATVYTQHMPLFAWVHVKRPISTDWAVWEVFETAPSFGNLMPSATFNVATSMNRHVAPQNGNADSSSANSSISSFIPFAALTSGAP